MVTVAFIWCFSCFNYCRGNCICAGQGNTVVSHFVVQTGDFTVAIACVPCGPRRSLIYACEWGFCVCWKLSAAEQVKPDCCHTPAVVSTLLTPLPVSCPLTTPHHYTSIRNNRITSHRKITTYRLYTRLHICFHILNVLLLVSFPTDTVSWLVGVQIKVIATTDLWLFIHASNLLPSTPHPTPLQKHTSVQTKYYKSTTEVQK